MAQVLAYGSAAVSSGKHGGTIDVASDTGDSSHGTVVSVFLAEKPVVNPTPH